MATLRPRENLPRLARPATAWTLLVVALGMYVACAVIYYSPSFPFSQNFGGAGFWFFPISSFAIVGALIAARRPSNPIGWLSLCMGAGVGLSVLCAAVGSLLTNAHQSAGAYVVLLSTLWRGSTAPALGLFVILLLIFPDGRLPSARWRFVLRALLLLMTAGLILDLVNPARGNLGASGNDTSVLAIPGLANLVNTLSLAFKSLLYALFLAAVVSMCLRLRGADADRGHQIRWVVYAGGLALAINSVLSTGVLLSNPSNLSALAIGAAGAAVVLQALAVPTAIAIAVLKYRLYDIDVIISRTLVYGALAVFITALYVGIAVGIGTLVGSGGKPNLSLSILATGIVAVGFQPLRERLQRLANRLVYGKRANPYEVLSEFSGRVAESYASDEVLPRMARVLAEGTAADLAEIWLRSGDSLRRAAAFPVDSSIAAPVQVDSTATPSAPSADRTVEVRHQSELLGALTVTKRRGESLTPIEIKLMDDLAHQAGLVLKNVGLTADLQARLDDLRASRQRLVAAQDDERRRLERNLHDGAQQHLVAIKVKLGLVEMLATRDPEKARATLVALKHDADEALETLRDLARGIYPPLLAEKGLAAALQSQAGKATLPVHVDADGVGRYPQETEAALYFCTLEALQNVQKYAVASAVTVRLRTDEKQLLVEVTDDGRGFDVTAVVRGAGLTNMEDRLDALGGTLQIESTPGVGTTLRATVPVSQVAPAATAPNAPLVTREAPGRA